MNILNSLLERAELGLPYIELLSLGNLSFLKKMVVMKSGVCISSL